jgi:hypothetical protein
MGTEESLLMSRAFLSFQEKLDRLVKSPHALWIIFVVGLLLRIVGAYMGGVHSDDGDRTYTDMANAFLSGQGFSLVREFGPMYSWLPPGMAMLNLPFFILFGSQAFFVQRVFFIVMSSVANVSLVCAAERLMSKQAA